MILKSDEIKKRLDDQDDRLIITPRPTKQALGVGSAAVDLRLGTWFLRLRHSRLSSLEIGSLDEARVTKTHYVRFGDGYYLHPKSFALGVTMEWLRLPKNLAGYVVGKSSLGRRGLIIATATGVHPGFTGCLTLELTNAGELPILIEPGMRVCQLFLHSVQGDPSQFDTSTFSCRRQPALGLIKRDEMADKLRAANSEASAGTLVGSFLANLKDGIRNDLFPLPEEQVDLITGFIASQSPPKEEATGRGLMFGGLVSGEIYRMSGTSLSFSLPGLYAGLHTILGSLGVAAPIAFGMGILAVAKNARDILGKMSIDAAAVIWTVYLRSRAGDGKVPFAEAVNAERQARGLPPQSEEQIKNTVGELIKSGVLTHREGVGIVLSEWLVVR